MSATGCWTLTKQSELLMKILCFQPWRLKAPLQWDCKDVCWLLIWFHTLYLAKKNKTKQKNIMRGTLMFWFLLSRCIWWHVQWVFCIIQKKRDGAHPDQVSVYICACEGRVMWMSAYWRRRSGSSFTFSTFWILEWEMWQFKCSVIILKPNWSE